MKSLEAAGDRPGPEDLSARRLSRAGQQLLCRAREAGPRPSALLSVSVSHALCPIAPINPWTSVQNTTARVLQRHERHTVWGTGSTARPPGALREGHLHQLCVHGLLPLLVAMLSGGDSSRPQGEARGQTPCKGSHPS